MEVKGRAFVYVNVPIRVHENGGGGFYADDIRGGGGEEAMSCAEEFSASPMEFHVNNKCSRTSELTISFEGQVHVFPAVTPEKAQAVLLLLGGGETQSTVPSSEVHVEQNIYRNKAVDEVSSQPTVPQRIASLERFREKRRERCFEKKIRYTCRKEVAQRMIRKNGQFASVKDSSRTSDDSSVSGISTQHPEPILRRCQHCGVSESSTPAMRRGPEGPRTLCNACGLMWANKGTLRDIKSGGRHMLGQNEPDTPAIYPALIEPVSCFRNPDEGLMEMTEGIAEDSSMGIENSSGNFSEQETVDELVITSGTEFEILPNFDEQVDVDSHMGSNWPGS